MSALSDLLNSQPITARQAAEKAASEGIDLRYGTIAAYWSGRHGRPTRETLAKLAKVLPLTEERLQRAAWNASAPLGPWVPPEASALLDQAQRRALDQLIKSIVRTKGAPHADQSPTPTDSSPSSGAPGQAGEGEEGDPLKRLNAHAEQLKQLGLDNGGTNTK